MLFTRCSIAASGRSSWTHLAAHEEETRATAAVAKGIVEVVAHVEGFAVGVAVVLFVDTREYEDGNREKE